jgi:hypothetical protein
MQVKSTNEPRDLPTVEPSLFRIGEGCQDWSTRSAIKSDHNDDLSSHHHGGVTGHGMFVQVLRLREEICIGGRRSLTASTSGRTARLALAGAEVGAARSSSEVANPHGAKGPYLIDACREGKDG